MLLPSKAGPAAVEAQRIPVAAAYRDLAVRPQVDQYPGASAGKHACSVNSRQDVAADETADIGQEGDVGAGQLVGDRKVIRVVRFCGGKSISIGVLRLRRTDRRLGFGNLQPAQFSRGEMPHAVIRRLEWVSGQRTDVEPAKQVVHHTVADDADAVDRARGLCCQGHDMSSDRFADQGGEACGVLFRLYRIADT